MNAEQLLAHYERVAEAPDAIAWLRGFVLDIAVRGKLVPQSDNEESAGGLLQRIASEKARRVKAGEARQPKNLPSPDDPPCALPKSWRWSCLAEIGFISPRVDADDDAQASFVPMPMIAAELGVAHQHEPRKWGEIKKGYTHFADGDVGLAKITPCFENGKSTVFRNLSGGIGSGTTELHVVRPLMVSPEYVLLFLKSSYFIETGIPRMTGTAGQKRVPAEYFAHSPFPLPPLAEQHRIVAKVEELMALCDRLEAARAQRDATRDRLTASTLARLNTPEPLASQDGDAARESSFQSDARFALKVLPDLTTRPDQIKQLRRTILNLAVQGKMLAAPAADEAPLGSLATIVRGSSPRPKADPRYYGGSIPRLLIADITRDGKRVTPRLDSLTEEGARLSRPMISGSLVIAISGSYGLPAFLAVDACIHDGFIGFRRISDSILPEYLYLVLIYRKPYFDDVVKDSGLKNLTTDHLKSLSVPCHPLHIQAQIVSQVDQLMSLCDQLEASLSRRDSTRSRLLNALLHEVLAPAESILEAA